MAFFVDRTRLTSDADTERVTLANEVAYLENTIPLINEEYSVLLKNLGELQALYNGKGELKAAFMERYSEEELASYLSETESRTRALYEKTDGAKARLLLSRFGSPSIISSGSLISELEPNEKTIILKRLAELDRGLTQIGDDKKTLDVIYAGKVDELNVAKAKLATLKESKYTENIFYAMRALSLGGLGALITLLASYMLKPPENGNSVGFINSSNYWSLLLSHTMMGAVVSSVIFGLFYTRQLTIFQPDMTASENVAPEFWRITMLCIIAGAFAEKLYSAASNRVDKYVEEPNKQVPPSANSGG